MVCTTDDRQGPLGPLGAVRTATTMKAATKALSRMINSHRMTLWLPVRRRQSCRMVARMVYATAAARMPSTAPLDALIRL